MPRSIRLVAFDMEGCLTEFPTVWEIMHRKVGTWESKGAQYWEQYKAGRLDYDTFARMDVAAWRGAEAALLDEAAAEVPLMPGCAELLEMLRGAGVHAAIISNGLTRVARRFRDGFNVRHIFANSVVVRGGRLTGSVQIRVPYEQKGAVLRRLCARLGVLADEVAAVGDSASDIAMFTAARVSVAFCASDAAVRAAATHSVEERDLRRVADILGLFLPPMPPAA